MLTLKVLSLLLSYPEAEVIEALDDLPGVLVRENLLPEADTRAVLAMIDSFRKQDLVALQENYVSLFDRGRHLSLHLFEHVHGESRDRGQAMVNLLRFYETHGFEIAARELPDYIPLFLEFLSTQTQDGAVQLLQDAMPVLNLLGARLNERGSPYGSIFFALSSLAGGSGSLDEICRQVAGEAPDDTLLHMDDIWEDEAVSFMGGGDACQSGTAAVSPVVVTSREDYIKSRNRSL